LRLSQTTSNKTTEKKLLLHYTFFLPKISFFDFILPPSFKKAQYKLSIETRLPQEQSPQLMDLPDIFFVTHFQGHFDYTGNLA